MIIAFGVLILLAALVVAFGISLDTGSARPWLRRVFYHLSAVASVRCLTPRMTPGAAKLTPEVVRETLDFKCNLWKYHEGEHEAEVETKLEGKTVKRWS
jgi:hypothetical protein